MTTGSKSSARTVWFLVGPFDSGETLRHLPIYTVPFRIGRRQDLALTLCCNTVSNLHAEITEANQSLVLSDLGSTNGTYVNGRRITAPVTLHEDDLVQFANMAFRVRQQAAGDDPNTVQENVCDRALALVQFDKLMADHAVTPFFQPIVTLPTKEVIGHEVLARSRLFGLETPKDMFRVAEELSLEVELSVMLRWEGVLASRVQAGLPHLFLNTHPRELAQAGLVASLEKLRGTHPDQPLTLEIHESAVADIGRMAEIRPALRDLNIGLAYDDFGVGQSRLNEMSQSPPDYVKFDISLIREIHAASPQRQEVVATLVQMVHKLGILSVAEGIETEAESKTCVAMGFDLGQGFFYGRPAPFRPRS
jgi:EAL domain-containing protein (putative c-di-GMP-specific phosphodiesterase class I)